MNRKILLVDDEPNILQGYKRQLRKQFDVETAVGGKRGLEILVQNGPFAVVVTDMQMPELDGIQFLKAVHRVSPNSVRLMLTGNADQKTAIEAVNDGHVFRFLTKPCSPEILGKALEAGLEQYRLVHAERELLTKTLGGSVSVMTEVLALVNPTAFGQATRIRRLVRQICQRMRVHNAWEIEIATMLSQIGCVTISEATLTKLYSGGALTPQEWQSYQSHPQVGHDLIAKIPRLESVAQIIACQQKCFDGSGVPDDGKTGDEIPLGSRILKLVIDFVQLTSADAPTPVALGVLRDRQGWYDPKMIECLAVVLDAKDIVRTVTVDQLEEGMILDEHVLNGHGDILLARGQDVTASVCVRLKKFSKSAAGIQEPIRVRVPIGLDEASFAAASATETAQV